MIWPQILFLSVLAGVVLYFTNKVASVGKRLWCYFGFVNIFTLLLTIAIEVTVMADSADRGNIYGRIMFAALLCVITILVSVFMRKYASLRKLSSYLALFVPLLWAVSLLIMLLLVGLFARS